MYSERFCTFLKSDILLHVASQVVFELANPSRLLPHSAPQSQLSRTVIPPSKNRYPVHMTPHTTGTMRRHTAQEEGPTALPATHLRHPLQIQHLPDRHAPQREKVLVQQIR